MKKIRKTTKCTNWRNSIYIRDMFKCVLCGYDKGNVLEADHIKPFALILEENKIKTLKEAYGCLELWNVDNGRTLCKNCHKTTSTYGSRTTKLIQQRVNDNGYI